jgi:nicotinate-nucleotide adenylyltransferase
MRIGVFGGTFDPPHLGHLVVAQEVYHRLGLDRVLWVPAAIPPHKQDQQITPGHLRLEMVRAAIADDERFDLCDLEIRRSGPSYTVDTLRALAEMNPSAELVLILGADQLAELDRWRGPKSILELASLVGFARDGEVPSLPEDVRLVEVPRMDVSSTMIRQRVGAGEPVSYLVPRSTEAVIRREALYEGGN